MLGVCFLQQEWPQLHVVGVAGLDAQKCRQALLLVLVHWNVVIHHNVFPRIVLVDFYIVYAVLIKTLTLKHFLQQKIVVFHAVEAVGEQITKRILTR